MPNEANANEKPLATEPQNAISVKPDVPQASAPAVQAKLVAQEVSASVVPAKPAAPKAPVVATLAKPATPKAPALATQAKPARLASAKPATQKARVTANSPKPAALKAPASASLAKPVASKKPTSAATVKPAVPKGQASVATPEATATKAQSTATLQEQSADSPSEGASWWARRSTFEKEVGFFVFLPTLLTFGYCALVASPMYVSETKFAVRNAVEQPMGIDIASQLFKTASTSVQDARIVDAYLRSPDVFEKLDGELQLTKHYSDTSRDRVSRLASSPTLWDKESFWQRVAQPKIDVDSGIVTFTVRAYTPDMAQSIAAGILRQGEALINEMNERSRNDAIRLAESEVKVAQERIVKAQKALEAFRDEHKELDPKATATGLQSLVFELEGERAKVKAELAEARSYMKPTAPQVKALEKRLVAVETQLNAEKARIAGNPSGGGAINSWVSQYENLMIESEFAQKQLTTAMSAYEQARSMALAKSRYLVAIQQPTLPDESRYPRTWVFTLCAFFGFFLIYGLVRLIVASIREHAGF